ncbi:hypothetical protein Tco_0475528, partial [Tanacetum coccineum]
METQPNDQDHLVNYDNDNDNDDLGYESKVYVLKEEMETTMSDGNVVKGNNQRYFDVDLTVKKLKETEDKSKRNLEVDINPINSSVDEEGGTTVVGCENDTSIQKSNGLATLEKEIETR